MQNGAMKAWLDSSFLSGANQSWIEQLYEDFLTDPDSVDANWRSMFQELPGTCLLYTSPSPRDCS